jgi:hypothetical protein
MEAEKPEYPVGSMRVLKVANKVGFTYKAQRYEAGKTFFCGEPLWYGWCDKQWYTTYQEAQDYVDRTLDTGQGIEMYYRSAPTNEV